MKRLRTLNQAAAEIKKADPGTAVTYNFLSGLVKNGTIPAVTVGTSKKYVDFDYLIEWLDNMGQDTKAPTS